MKLLQLRSRQRDRKLNIKLLERLVRDFLDGQLELSSYELAIHFVSARKMAEVNQRFLHHNGSTDVITFDFHDGYDEFQGGEPVELAGEIYISVADAVTQSVEFRTDWREELARYIVHGILHLLGYDDLDPAERKIMKREENRHVKHLSQRLNLSLISV